MHLTKEISGLSETKQSFYFFTPEERYCFSMPLFSPIRSGEQKSKAASLAGRVQPVYSAEMQMKLDLSLEIVWKNEIQQKLLLNDHGPKPVGAEEIRCWLNNPTHAWRIRQVKSLRLRYFNLAVFPPEISCFTNLEALDLSNNPSIRFLMPWAASFQQLKHLNLSNCGLSNLPSDVFTLTDLEFLEASNNQLTSLPDEIGSLTRLKYLSLHHNPFRALSQSFSLLASLNNLEHLDLSACGLSTLPHTIGSFGRLELLDLSLNKLKVVPDGLANLKRLKVLHLYQNRLESLPSALGNLSCLELLELSDNQIDEIPPAIGQLSQLKYLHLSGNRLQELPEETGKLKALLFLHLARNQLTKIPEILSQLPLLCSLNVSCNRLTGIPEKILVQMKRIPDFDLSLHTNPMLFLSRPSDLLQPFFGEYVSHEEILTKYHACSVYHCKSLLAALCQEIHCATDTEILQEKCEKLPSYIKKRIDAFLRELSHPASFDIDLLPEAIIAAVREKFQKLLPQQKQLVYNTIWKLAGSPKGIPHQWGAAHAEKNIIRLIDAMELHLEYGPLHPS